MPDTPGHCIGHMCGLARVTGGPDSTFILMGGDICHFGGALRPCQNYSLPEFIPEGLLDASPGYFPNACPCTLFTDNHPVISDSKNDKRRPQETPFYEVSTHATSAYVDPAKSQSSINRLTQLDASPSILVCLSHDGTLLRYLPTLNDSPDADINDWKAQGWKEKCHWGWLNEMPRGGKPGRKPIVEGFWRDGNVWKTAKDELREMGEKAFRANGLQSAGSGL